MTPAGAAGGLQSPISKDGQKPSRPAAPRDTRPPGGARPNPDSRASPAMPAWLSPLRARRPPSVCPDFPSISVTLPSSVSASAPALSLPLCLHLCLHLSVPPSVSPSLSPSVSVSPPFPRPLAHLAHCPSPACHSPRPVGCKRTPIRTRRRTPCPAQCPGSDPPRGLRTSIPAPSSEGVRVRDHPLKLLP